MKRSIVFAVPHFTPLIDVARRAEAEGFDRLWTTENPGRDGLVRALTIGLATERIGVASGIAYVFTRTPLSMAATAADIYEATGGRFSLGLGAGTQGMRSRWYGITEFDHAASRLEEYVHFLREVWASPQSFAFDGRFYRGNYSELDGERPRVPVWGSGINETMLRIAARSCDGVAVHPLGAHETYLDQVVIPAINAGVKTSGRPVEHAQWRVTAIDDDSGVARDRARRALAFYFSTPSYAAPADVSGWGEIARQVREAYRDKGPQWDSISSLVPDEMVSEFCFAGTPDEVVAQFDLVSKAYSERGVTEIVLQAAASGTGEETLANLDAIVATLGLKRI